MISKELIELLQLFEGFRSLPYLDSAGLRTIGYGHLVASGRHNGNIFRLLGVQDSTLESISEYDAMRLLVLDIKLISEPVMYILEHLNLSQNKLDAVISLVYNIGIWAFKTSTLLKKLQLGDIEGASDEFIRWNKVTIQGTKTISKGLTRRRRLEQELFNGE